MVSFLLTLLVASPRVEPSEEVHRAFNMMTKSPESVIYSLRTPNPETRNSGPTPEAVRAMRRWANRVLKAPYRMPADERVFATYYPKTERRYSYDHAVLRYEGESATERWGYYDLGASAYLLLETKGEPMRFADRAAVGEYWKTVLHRTINLPRPTFPRVSAYASPTELPSGRTLWRGDIRRDTQTDEKGRVISKTAWWRDFEFWTDGVQTCINWDFYDPFLPDRTYKKGEIVPHRLKGFPPTIVTQSGRSFYVP